MAQFVAMSPDVEVNGETVRSVILGMGTFKPRAVSILAEHGIEDPRPGRWYSQQGWLNAFRHIADEIGPNTLYQIGMKIPESAKFPSQIRTVENALEAIDVAYHMNHRGGYIGHYRYEAAGPAAARIVCDNPYPCEFDRGIIQAMAKRFAGGRPVGVRHDGTGSCRTEDGPYCTYVVSW
jgi:hypothetical protein